MSQQQTVLRVETNIPTNIEVNDVPQLSISGSSIYIASGSGTTVSPYTVVSTGNTFTVILTNTGGASTFNYNLTYTPTTTGTTRNYLGTPLDAYTNERIVISVQHVNNSVIGGDIMTYGNSITSGTFELLDGDIITITGGNTIPAVSMFFSISSNDNVNTRNVLSYSTLDLYGDVPIKINKSYAELEDIAKRNSDYSIGLTLPGSKKNNRFFESYFNVDNQTLYFDPTKRVNCDVLIDDEKYFSGYLRLNKVSVLNSKQEYDVTLYSIVGDLYGKIGNNLLKDLNYNDVDFPFNHNFNLWNVTGDWHYPTMLNDKEVPALYFYPVVHNGYEYDGENVNFGYGEVLPQTGDTYSTTGVTRLYTSTVVGSYNGLASAAAAGVKENRINSQFQSILDNQLKPAMNIWGIIQLMFKTYGYTIKSEFFKTPWFKLMYMYGYFSSQNTKLTITNPPPTTLPLSGVDVLLVKTTETIYDTASCPPTTYDNLLTTVNAFVVKKGTGIPVNCSEDIIISFDYQMVECYTTNDSLFFTNIYANTTGTTWNYYDRQYTDCGFGCPFQAIYTYDLGFNAGQSNVNISNQPLAYLPSTPNESNLIEEQDYVNFSLLIDQNLKQIDLLSSIAKKFNLVIVPDANNPNQIIIEPYEYYVGTGDVYDWSDKLSFDKGFTVEPALNFIEPELILTDLEDGDDGNKIFKDRNNRLYGQNKVWNPTDFKSSTKRIETIFSPEIIREWDNNISLPLGINYAASSSETGDTNIKTSWYYKGLKSKPKLFYNLGNFNPFVKNFQTIFTYATNRVNTNLVRLMRSNATTPSFDTYEVCPPLGICIYWNYYEGFENLAAPVISHTMPLGNPDANKINNDSICNLFNSEPKIDLGGISSFDAYTENDMYNLFYENRINNLYNPNTRLLSGNFYLKLSDIKNLKANDLIKINEQYFTVNKIDGYNLTNTELTKVSLLQVNVEPKTYPTRYFKYQYCGNANVYKFRTYFNPEENPADDYGVTDTLRRTYYYWSIVYDYFIGVLGGNGSGYVTSYERLSNGQRWSYRISEIDETEYNSITLNHTNDPNDDFFINKAQYLPKLFQGSAPDIMCLSNNGTDNKGFLNVDVSCTAFNAKCAANGVVLQAAPTPV